MFSGLSVEAQVYLAVMLVGVSSPLLVYWMLRAPLRQFLHDIFICAEIERFWLRVVLIVMIGSSMSAAIAYRPDSTIVGDFIAMIFSFADRCQLILQSLLWSIAVLFLPLLAAYTVLHAGRRKDRTPADEKAK